MDEPRNTSCNHQQVATASDELVRSETYAAFTWNQGNGRNGTAERQNGRTANSKMTSALTPVPDYM